MSKNKEIVYGYVKKGFEPVKQEFLRNFESRDEIGAACSIYYKGEKVVDLWGGSKDKDSPWQEDTMALIFSASKGLASMVFAKLHSMSLLDYDEKISTYWPEFSAFNKQDITIRQLLSHQAGLVISTEKLPIDKLNDFDFVQQVISQIKPSWNPGDYQGYQAGTIGFFMGEIVRRVDVKHRSLGQFFKEEIANPLQLESYIGLPDTINDTRVAQTILIHPLKAVINLHKMPKPMRKALVNPFSLFMKSTSIVKGYNPNKRETWKVEQPSGNAITTARSLAYAYSVFANNGKELNLSKSTLKHLNLPPEQVKKSTKDQVIFLDTRYGLGFMKPDPTFTFSPNPNAFGFLGATGSFAFADENEQIGYAYLTRKMGYYGINDPREANVRHQMYQCIERLKNSESK